MGKPAGPRRALRVTPSGDLLWEPTHAADEVESAPPLPAATEARLAAEFDRGAGFGLLYLGAALIDTPLPAGFSFFRDFAQKLLSAVCALPDVEAQRARIQVPPPPLAPAVAAAPPFAGLEYLTEEALFSLWQKAAAALTWELARFEGTVEAYLRQQNPAWHIVGRICFHLAENPRDEAAPFAFLCTYARAAGATGASRKKQAVQHVPLAQALKEYARAEDKPALLSLLAPVQRAAEKSELCKALVDSGQIYHPLRFSPKKAYALLREVPALEAAGVVVRLPDFWKARRAARPQVKVRVGEQVVFGAEALLDFSVQVALGNEELTAEEWQALLKSDEPLVRLRGQWVELDRERLREVLAHWQCVQKTVARDGISFIEGMRLLAGADLGTRAEAAAPLSEAPSWSQVSAGAALTELLGKLRDPELLSRAEEALAESLKTTLRPYQKLGVRWLHFLSGLGLGGCLADDMGLGKTVQVLALLLLRKREPAKPPALLVAPASLLANWCAEAARFAPSLRILLAHPSGQADGELAALTPDALSQYDLLITSYGYLQRLPQLQHARFGLVILDEAQAIKNPGAKQSRAVKSLRSDVRLLLTGTPIENRLSDLWSLFDFLHPGLLGSTQEFQRFVQRLGKGSEQGAGAPSFAPLRELVRPYILRRMKTDPRVITDLPDKTEVTAYCLLSRTQAGLYQRTVEELAQKLNALDGIKRRGAVLSCLMRLKQICNHPAQALGHGAFIEADSGKLQRLREICETIAAKQEKALVFTQFREMCTPLWDFLSGVFGRPGLILHGETAVGKRQALVEAFQQTESGAGPPYFVLSLKAGGTGLNLTAAAHVIHFDRWWNPAVEDQATDRAFRIGQHKNVLVHKLVCRGTLEERVDAMLRDKRSLAGEVLGGGGELPLTELQDTEILRLLTLDLSRALGDS